MNTNYIGTSQRFPCSERWFRSIDPVVMSHVRFLCAISLPPS